MMVIDTTNPEAVDEFKTKIDLMDYEQRKKGFYDVNDFAIIRSTDFLSEDHIIRSISKVPFVYNINNVAHSAIYSILRDKLSIDVYGDDEEYKKFLEMTYQYSPLSSQFRSTIHFTLNGLVSSHSKGSFDNQNFIIIDKLGNHLGKDDFRTIRMEDTFVYSEFPISDEAEILVNEDKYKKLLEQYPFLDSYNVVLFRGDEKLATEMYLASVGIVPEKIEQHSSEYTRRTELYQKYISSVTKELGITQEKHVYSKEYREDDEKNLLLWKIYDTKFYNELFDYFKIEENDKLKMIDFLTDLRIDNFDQKNILVDFINKVGLEKYQEFVLQYNQNINNAINMGIYPTNEEILESGSIEFKTKKTL